MADTYKPTEAMASAARRGLKMREGQSPSNRGGTAVGLARANQLIKRESLSLDTVKRMYSFFRRHEVDKQSDSWKEGNSKGEQAWLLWGGDAGYSWSRKIVKSLETNMIKQEDGKFCVYSKSGKSMGCYDSEEAAKERLGEIEYFKEQNHRVQIVQAVNSGRVVDDGEYLTIKDVSPIVDDIVMNGGLYPAAEIAASYSTLEGTVAPLGHPVVNGEYVSALEGEALQKFYIGAVNRNVRYDGGKVLMDVVINKAQALAHPRGSELIERIANGGEPIHVSTGVLLQRNERDGESKGKKYKWVASNMSFDHNAILLDQPGAGTPEDGVGMFFNSEEVDVYMIQNMEAGVKLEMKEEETAGLLKFLLDMLAKAAPEGYNLSGANIVPNHSPENDEMNETEVKEYVGNMLANAEAAFSEKLDAANAKITELESALKANAEAEHGKLVAEAAEVTGLEANALQGMTAEGLTALIAKSKPAFGVNTGKPAAAADDYIDADYSLNSAMEDK